MLNAVSIFSFGGRQVVSVHLCSPKLLLLLVLLLASFAIYAHSSVTISQYKVLKPSLKYTVGFLANVGSDPMTYRFQLISHMPIPPLARSITLSLSLSFVVNE